ncbi:MAG TPA: cob(I)yrinic acid a,c-diamide adenosyltransferase, partial [Myxococcaceae bacterium]|nr:cob(I)yrinic acid a,c-diamide adenosyltransferase [Myxococcaceae bacterium]
GETGLFGRGRVPKDDPRVDAYGEVDELNAAVGLARGAGLDPELDVLAQAIQDQLFTVGSVLATPRGTKAAQAIPQVEPRWVAEMETAIDKFDREIPPLRSFILPGGSAAAAALHLARTICRRAERRVVPLARKGTVDQLLVTYLNRLSDLLFTMARVSNHRAGIKDVVWNPPKPP